MNFDLTINLGQIATLAVTLIGGIYALGAMRSEFSSLLGRVSRVEEAITKQTDILVAIGRQEVRLDGHETRIEHLEARR